jgi:hypothetical protein
MYGEAVKLNLILVADNPVAADALGARVAGFSPHAIESIAIAEKAGLGSLSPEDIEINQDWQRYRQQFRVEKTAIDRVSTLLFHNNTLAKLVMDSPLTPVIYKVAGVLRTKEEREITSQIGKRKTLGPY